MTEKLCLKLNDFQENLNSAFGSLREDKDFTDVTLACEDGSQVEAHKVILAASSPFFRDILNKNKHSHPLIFMRGLKSQVLLAIMDFLYIGEANVQKENLDSFLALAEELRLKGLTGTQNSEKMQEPTRGVEENFRNIPAMKREKESETKSRPEYHTPTNSHTVVAIENGSNIEDLDEQIKSMMTKTDVRTATGQHYIATCNICGKQAATHNIQSHIEANHITGVSHACHLCGKTSRSREALRMHKHKYHKIIMQN